MASFNHMFAFAFEVVSQKEDASDVTNEMLFAGCRGRLDRLEKDAPNEIQEACQPPLDTFEME